MDQKTIQRADTLLKPTTSKAVLKIAIKSLRPKDKDETLKSIYIIVLSVLPSLLIGFSENTVSIFIEMVETIQNVYLALFGIVFTGYALFQALLTEPLLICLMECEGEESEEKSKLQETNEFFIILMMLMGICILVSLFLQIIISCIPDGFTICKSLYICNSIAAFLSLLYLSYVLLVIVEIKSFIFNMFQLFNLHAGTRFIDIMNSKSEVKGEEEHKSE